jgi:FKBP-type peptidyl-prolyl cis-trans isomerase SlyD
MNRARVRTLFHLDPFNIPARSAMNIEKNSAVTLSYHLSTPAGKPLDKGQLSYLHGGYEGIFPKVEAALQDQTVGFTTTLDLSVEDAFGARDETLARTIPKADFPPGVKVGGQLEGVGDDGTRQVFRVIKIKGDQVLLDGNHALAGESIRFALKVLAVRAATPDEIAHQHVHGEHGHHH